VRLTFPHMGTLHIPLKALFRGLGCDVVVPPPTSKRTLEVGVKHCPEFACLPLKISVGNLAEALDLGADTVVMAGGVGPCRFGFYGELQREILRDNGYEFRMVIVDPPQGRARHVIESLRSLFPAVRLCQALHAMRLAWSKIVAIDRLESLANRSRALERERGAVSAALNLALQAVDAAETAENVWLACEAGVASIESLVDQSKAERAEHGLVRVAVVGEIYVVLEPFANHCIERKLGEMNAIVERPLSISHWLKLNVLLDFFNMSGGFRPGELARPYLGHSVGGHGRETIAGAVKYAKRGYDGVIQVAPFTCMPEIVAESVLNRVSKDYGIPSMSLVVDEQTGEAGVVTRLEAFVDMLERRKLARRPVSERLTVKKALCYYD
jgi:predicted nucleotide-binding protein (sugar kinase/HSP70/actin superfamily)